MVSEDKSNGEPNRIRMLAVDPQLLRYAVAAADRGRLRRAVDTSSLLQDSPPTSCSLRHFRTKPFRPRHGPRFKSITEFETGCSATCRPPAARPGKVGKWRQRLKRFLPDCWDIQGDPSLLGQSLLDLAVSNDEPGDINPKRDRSSVRQLLRSHICAVPRYFVFAASVDCLSLEGLVREARSCARS